MVVGKIVGVGFLAVQIPFGREHTTATDALKTFT